MPNLSAAIAAMDKACRIWSVGYDQSNRWDIRNGGETDCSALVIWALKQGGFDTGGASYTGNMSANLTARGWKRLPPDLKTAQPGDILLNDTHHTCMVVRGHGLNAIIAQASIDERGRASGGRGGDQTGGETNERKIYTYRHGWDCILRYVGAQTAPKPASDVLAVDGYIGEASTRKWQKVMGTPQDGVISGQWRGNQRYLYRLTSIQWGKGGSQLVTRVQRVCGVAADGVLGPDTVKAIQRRLGVSADGYFGPATAIALQKRLNTGKF